jgi:hypothetical protein
MTLDDLQHLKDTVIKRGIRVNMADPIWKKAFEFYNNKFPERRPLSMECRPCYMTVTFFVQKELNQEPFLSKP